MSVLERYKQRSAYKKSEDASLSSVQENIYQPSSLSPDSTQAEGVTPVPQLSFTDDPINPVSGEGLTTPVAPETPTALVPQDNLQPQVAETEQATAPADKPLRAPVRIRGTGKKSSGTLLAPKVTGKRPLVHAAMVALTVCVVLTVLVTVVPTADGQPQGFSGLFHSLLNWSQGKDHNSALSASQIATATAVMQDGYDAGGNVNYAGIPGAPSGSANLNRFFYGQCTYYANMEYGALTGHYVDWLGNANQWVYGAMAAGWVVTDTPHVPAIIAFDSGVDGAGWYGHVGVTTSVNGTNVTYGSWNVAGAPFATTVYLTVTAPAPGVHFIYYPGL